MQIGGQGRGPGNTKTHYFSIKDYQKNVKVIEVDIYGKLFEIYKETEKGRVS